MDFEKLLQQRQAKEAAVDPQVLHVESKPVDLQEMQSKREAAAEAWMAANRPAQKEPAPKPKRKPEATGSKRRTWKMRAWFVRPETANRLRAFVNRQQETGSTIDASDVVDQAITAWLDQQGA